MAPSKQVAPTRPANAGLASAACCRKPAVVDSAEIVVVTATPGAPSPAATLTLDIRDLASLVGYAVRVGLVAADE
jgi:hypothetical protein